MIVHSFTFGPFSENTFLIYNESGEAWVIDPGMSNRIEEAEFSSFIEENELQLTRLLLTHGHIDHVMGNAFVCEKYNLEVEAHPLAAQTIDMSLRSAEVYGIPYTQSPMISKELNEGDVLTLGDNKLDILFTPGHAPGHIVFVNHKEKWVINGDVLFQGSVGRVDLPGSNPSDLVKSILTKMYTLPEDYKIYCGHGPSTTIGFEKANNPFVNERTNIEDYI